MNGRIVSGGIVAVAVIAGAAIYWLQVYAFYAPVPVQTGVALVAVADGAAVPVPVTDFTAIDATSSPLRYRACFTMGVPVAGLTATYVSYPAADPLLAPRWFDCFDAAAIGTAIRAGEATAFLSQENVGKGVDRVVAVFPDGRAFGWHQLNGTLED